MRKKLAHLQHEEWLAQRAQPNADRMARALEVLDKPVQHVQAPGDELPDGYVPIRRTREYKLAARAK